MKKIKGNNKSHEFFQDIVNTYRYPDGTLNGIAVFISALALILLLVLGHFVIAGINNLKSIRSVSASELTLSEIEQYITDTYLDAVNEYSNGSISHEAAKKKILGHIATYLDSSEAFSEDQKQQILDSISMYLEELNLEKMTSDNAKEIERINNTFDTYVKNNETTLSVLKDSIMHEIENNSLQTSEQLEILNGLQKKLESLEISNFNTLNDMLSEANQKIDQNYNTFITQIYSGTESWSAEKSYKPNDYVLYNNKLYKNITGINTSQSPGSDTKNWVEASITTVIYNTYNTFLTVTGATDYNPSTPNDYSSGDYVVYNNIIYKNVSDNPATGDSTLPGSSDSWMAVTITDMIENNYTTLINSIGAEDYNTNHSYQAGNYTIYNGVLYRAIDVTSGIFDESKWEKVSVTSQIETLSGRVDTLELKTATDLVELNESLTKLIADNKSLTDNQRRAMLDLISGNADASAAGLQELYNQLLGLISDTDDLATTNEKERLSLLEQLKVLQNNTTSVIDDYEKRIKDIEDRTTDGEAKFDFGYQNGVYGYYVENTFYPF